MPTPPEAPADVTVLGAGLMGRALVRALADAGHTVAVWNRNHDRAAALAGVNVLAVESAAEAVRAAPLVVACLSTYDAVRTTLDQLAPSGLALVNLTSGTPQGAEDLARWSRDKGIDYLDGAILAFPDFIGAEDAIIAYSGSSQVWETYSQTLRALAGQSQWVGERVGAANVLDGSLIISFYTSAVTSYVEAATYALDQGIPEDLLRSATRLVLRTIGHSTKEAARAIASGEYATDQAKLSTYAVGARSTLTSMREMGLPARLLSATVDSLETAAGAGLGDLGLYAQAPVTRAAPAPR